MKEFNKWNQKENKYNHECYSGILAKGWKAALEWAISRCWSAETIDDIRKELED